MPRSDGGSASGRPSRWSRASASIALAKLRCAASQRLTGSLSCAGEERELVVGVADSRPCTGAEKPRSSDGTGGAVDAGEAERLARLA